MSYSLSPAPQGANKAELRTNVEAAMNAMIQSQPVHSRDLASAMSCFDTQLALLEEATEGEQFTCYMNGSLSTSSDKIMAASVGVSVSKHDKR